MSQQVQFFATRSDLFRGVEQFEASEAIDYVLCKMDQSKEFKSYTRLSDWEPLGSTNSGSHIGGDFFLVKNARTPLNVEEVPQKRGGVLYAIGQNLNPSSMVLRPGGIYRQGLLICGSAGTASDSTDSLKLYQAFKQSLARAFKKVKKCFVGDEALRLADDGWRLITMHTGEDPSYDLRVR
jgi:hypothetical protein